MLITGCDYHPSMQQIAYVDTETGEGKERRLMHRDGEAGRFYRELKQRQIEVRVGMEATGYARWFERLLAELGFDLPGHPTASIVYAWTHKPESPESPRHVTVLHVDPVTYPGLAVRAAIVQEVTNLGTADTE